MGLLCGSRPQRRHQQDSEKTKGEGPERQESDDLHILARVCGSRHSVSRYPAGLT